MNGIVSRSNDRVRAPNNNTNGAKIILLLGIGYRKLSSMPGLELGLGSAMISGNHCPLSSCREPATILTECKEHIIADTEAACY